MTESLPAGKIGITVRLFSFLCSYVGKQENRCFFEMDVPQGVNSAGLCALLKIPDRIPKVILINGTVKEEGYSLQPGDEVSILPPLEGG